MNHDNLRQELLRVFDALAARYGAEWSGKWSALPLERIVEAWHAELARFNGSAQYVAELMDEALKHLPERAPNAVTFRHLCEHAHEAMRRPPPATSAGVVRGPTPMERDALLRLRDRVAAGALFARPSPAWAFELVERAARGEAVCHAGLKMARDVVESESRKRTARAPVPDAYGAHPSAAEGDGLPALPQE